MSKPDWKDAPEWASWLAMGRFGYWKWYERKPTYGKRDEDWFSGGKEELASEKSHEDTLEERP